MKFLMAMFCLLLVINIRAMEMDNIELDNADKMAMHNLMELKSKEHQDIGYLLMAIDQTRLGPDPKTGEYPDEFYKQVIIQLKKEEAEKTVSDVSQECKGCGMLINPHKTVTHLVDECDLKIVEDSLKAIEKFSTLPVEVIQKIVIIKCKLCNRAIPENGLLAHKLSQCSGERYKVKRNMQKKRELERIEVTEKIESKKQSDTAKSKHTNTSMRANKKVKTKK